MPYKILVVDDEADGCELLKTVLERENFHVLTAGRAEDAFAAAASQRPDAVISDVVMPRLSGLSLCRRLRGDRRTAGLPIVLISGVQKDCVSQAQALDAGADDYWLKPFDAKLLAAKLRALLRRSQRYNGREASLCSGALRLDLDARTARVGARAVQLTRKEFDLLCLMMQRPRRVLGASFLLETVWGYDSSIYRDNHTIEVHISSLRQKLGPSVSSKIVTVPGLGYRFDAKIKSVSRRSIGNGLS